MPRRGPRGRGPGGRRCHGRRQGPGGAGRGPRMRRRAVRRGSRVRRGGVRGRGRMGDKQFTYRGHRFLPADQIGGRSRQAAVPALREGRGRFKGRVVFEYRLVESGQFRPGIHPQFVGRSLAQLGVGGQRFGLPSGPVQRSELDGATAPAAGGGAPTRPARRRPRPRPGKLLQRVRAAEITRHCGAMNAERGPAGRPGQGNEVYGGCTALHTIWPWLHDNRASLPGRPRQPGLPMALGAHDRPHPNEGALGKLRIFIHNSSHSCG